MKPEAATRCTMLRLDVTDPERAVESPALASLIAAGWSIGHAFVGAEREKEWLMLLMVPPLPLPAQLNTTRIALVLFAASFWGTLIGGLATVGYLRAF